MSKFWSPFVKVLVPYVPGEQPKLAKLVKLNTNENPYGPSPKAIAAMQAELSDALRLYPDPNSDRLKQAVARGMGALLNARSVGLGESIEQYPQARNSMIDYGITDLSSLSLLDPGDRAYLRDKIRITVQRHEPRLGHIAVSLDAPAGTERMLRFRVDARLEVLPTRPPVRFDARLQLSSNACQVKEN